MSTTCTVGIGTRFCRGWRDLVASTLDAPAASPMKMRVGSRVCWKSRTLKQMRWPRRVQPWRMRQRLTLRPVQRTRHHQRHQQRHWRLRVHVPLRKIMRTTVQSLTSTLPPPLLEPSVPPLYVLLDLRPLLLKFLMQLLIHRARPPTLQDHPGRPPGRQRRARIRSLDKILTRKGGGSFCFLSACQVCLLCLTATDATEASTLGWLYQLPLQAAAWGELHRCFQDWSSSVCSELGVPASLITER